MIPWGAIVVAAIAASRSLNANQPQGPGVPTLGAVVILLRWLLAFTAFVFTVALAIAAATPFAPVVLLVGFALVAVLTRPSLLLEHVFVPRGLARAAYWWAFLTFPSPVVRDPIGGRCFYAARALLQRPSLDVEAAALVESALTAERKTQRTGVTVVAEGLLAIARGSVEHGRALLASASPLEPAVFPAVARTVARTWLVADALAAGDVDRALRASEGVGFTPWPRLIREEIERARGGKRFWWSELRLGALWLLSPARRATRRYFEAWRERTVTLPAETGDAMADALAVHRLLLVSDPAVKGYATLLAEGCRRWEAALASTAVLARIERRRLALNLTDDASVLLGRFAAEVEGDLVVWAGRFDGSLAQLDACPLGERVRYATRADELGEIESLLETFRAQTGDDFPPAAEAWALFARLDERVAAALRRHGDDARATLANDIFHAVTNWNCRLYNDAREHALGRAVFVWIRAHADTLPARDLQLAIKNAKVLWY